MLKKKYLNNYFILKIKKQFIKNELKKIILKSIIKNQKIKPSLRIYAMLKLENLKYSNSISKHFNTCLLTGKTNSIINKFSRSRQIVKNLGLKNKLQNTNIKSW